MSVFTLNLSFIVHFHLDSIQQHITIGRHTWNCPTSLEGLECKQNPHLQTERAFEA